MTTKRAYEVSELRIHLEKLLRDAYNIPTDKKLKAPLQMAINAIALSYYANPTLADVEWAFIIQNDKTIKEYLDEQNRKVS